MNKTLLSATVVMIFIGSFVLAQTMTPKAITVLSVTPSQAIAGTQTVAIFEVRIDDYSVIANSVNILHVQPDGGGVVVGTMRNMGGGLFSLTTVLPQSLPLGKNTFRASAGFLGSVRRIQSSEMNINILAAPQTAAWITVTPDSRFTISVPSIVRIETEATRSGGTTNHWLIKLSDGTTLGQLSLFSSSAWTAELQTVNEGGKPVYLTEGKGFVIGYYRSQNDWNTLGLDSKEAKELLTQILSTIKIK